MRHDEDQAVRPESGCAGDVSIPAFPIRYPRGGAGSPPRAAMRAARAPKGDAEFKSMLEFPVMVLFRFRS
jgi:hypothetical protein